MNTQAAGAKPQRPKWVDWYKLPGWRKRSDDQLKRFPWCAFHLKQGEHVKAKIADHVEPHKGDAWKFWHGRLQSLCKECHSSIKQSMERGYRSPCDDAGLPTDPSHPWNR